MRSFLQEAQLPQRNGASAAHVDTADYIGWLDLSSMQLFTL